MWYMNLILIQKPASRTSCIPHSDGQTGVDRQALFPYDAPHEKLSLYPDHFICKRRGFETPVILADYPAQLAALARIKADEPEFAERFELYVGGLELANGFSELTDPQEQRNRFEEANRIRQRMGKPELPLPEPFLAELSAMPPSAGIALGVDRLVMLTIGADSIDQVVAFTPESL